LDVQRRGPVTLQELVSAYGQSMNAESLVWKKGMKDWTPVREVPEVRYLAFLLRHVLCLHRSSKLTLSDGRFTKLFYKLTRRMKKMQRRAVMTSLPPHPHHIFYPELLLQLLLLPLLHLHQHLHQHLHLHLLLLLLMHLLLLLHLLLFVLLLPQNLRYSRLLTLTGLQASRHLIQGLNQFQKQFKTEAQASFEEIILPGLLFRAS
jgi:hypothetical protein